MKWNRLSEVDESKLVCEMSNKRKDLTHLPMNIWIDEAQTYLDGGHSKRVKFQLDSGNKFNKHNLGSMDLDGNLHCSDIGNLSASDINQLRNFVLNNRYALDKIADNDIWIDEIWDSMIMGGEPASFDEITKLNLKVDELLMGRSVS